MIRVIQVLHKFRLRLVLALIVLSFYISGLTFLHLVTRASLGVTEDDTQTLAHGTPQDVFPRELSENKNNDVFPRFDSEQYLGKLNTTYIKRCEEHKNFVFIKCMKCATETMATILRRFGLVRNLSFVVPTGKKLYLGWPFPLTERDYRPSKTSTGFNILVEHAIYTKDVMKKMMPNDSKYITIIRQPYNHFKSVFNYFNIANVAKVPGPDMISTYLHDLDKYEGIYKSPEASPIRYCIPDNFSMTHNLLSHCLGVPLGFPAGRTDIKHDPSAIDAYIRDLDRDFSLVMIMEYFTESLVLLRRLMCWSVKDVLYHSVNTQDYHYKKAKPKEENVQIYSKWSHLDYKLYDYFNKTFWRKVESEGKDFQMEVYFLKETQAKFELFCFGGGQNSSSHLQIFSTPWSDSFQITHMDCDIFQLEMFDEIKKRYDKL